MMKKLSLLLVMLSLYACKPSISAVNTKLDHDQAATLQGQWKLTSVTYTGQEYFKVNVFQIADSKCFVGSTWKLIANNNKGEMAITQTNCPDFSTPITWYINKDGQFVLKFVEQGNKAKNVTEGYVLQLKDVSTNGFTLVDKINVGNKSSDIVYRFEKY